MKFSAAILAFAALALAAPANEDTAAAVKTEESTIMNELAISAPGEFSAQAYCGGYSNAGCSNICFNLRFRCYTCRPTTCFCSNTGC